MSKYGQLPAKDGLVAHGISMYKYNYIRSVIPLERSYNLLADSFLLLTESVAMFISGPAGFRRRYIFRQHGNMNNNPVK